MMRSVLSEQVLVLNRSWVPVHVASVRRALTLVFLDEARIVSPADYATLDFDGWISASQDGVVSDRTIRAANFELFMPEVIVLTAYNGYYLKEVRCTRRNIFERDNHSCQYCGRSRDNEKMTIDHVLPRSRGGRTTWENVVLACLDCNSRKGDRLPQEAGMRLINHPVKPSWASRMGVRLGGAPKESWHRFIIEAS